MGDGGYGKELGLDAIRALHQTVIALRTALEESKSEILELKSKSWPIETVQDALKALTIENAALKRKIVQGDFKGKDGAVKDKDGIDCVEDVDTVVNGVTRTNTCENDRKPPFSEAQKLKKVQIVSPKLNPKKTTRNLETKISVKAETSNAIQTSRSLESLTVIKSPLEGSKHFSISKTFSFSNLSANIHREFNFDVKMGDRSQNAQPQENAIETSIDEEPEEVSRVN
ncbi:unnamed protein product [Acanthoscelides obtectus]|uniref:Uncharacterized protein n=1 Tax=Acanthoscelides obtectus TaxID=200917 RepID=A0A9P0LSI6_ACAOB|nr:unnamed protein product [Acanthoscelides obtectus]CAK1664328.1 hypothetical protein AOBTE_LOCUS24202 [Acanthoscelides obtectus]